MQRKLKDHAYMQAHVDVNYDGDSQTLVSYDTPVITITRGRFNGKDVKFVTCTGLYSRTTIKHIGLFLKEFGIEYYSVKLIAGAANWCLVVDPEGNPYVNTYWNYTSGEVINVNIPLKPSQYKKLADYMQADWYMYYDGWDMRYRW